MDVVVFSLTVNGAMETNIIMRLSSEADLKGSKFD
jgi:hypothetical protein